MLKIKIVAVGNIKENYFKDAINEYEKRISKFANVMVKEVPECSTSSSISIEKIKEIESNNVKAELEGYVVLLDKGGKNFTSEDFAEFFEKKSVQGISKITFAIGGSYGFNDEIKKNADLMLSFGKMTFPHQLMRVVLFEQIYRAFTINNGVTYHK